ncbi:MAG TPA: SIS domain-containing protein [Streptomyces sp.]|uniref:D-sedoheptulose-7-phosphate isomerase n=1 Tax=Streptomyces sp. TaxID=1931 RepID=UPI002D6D89B5|nr:SIS domain-containing protein [Streptomyces sp.]HZG04031.1 SIS domain-containing protein [Streptomyces sp.]
MTTTPRTTSRTGRARKTARAAAPEPEAGVGASPEAPGTVAAHCDALLHALTDFRTHTGTAQRWGERLARVLAGGGRLLAAGNGGSAAQAQHLTAELVGRYRDDRPPFSAIALHADTSSTTAIANDYGVDEVFARQVRAHGREGDVLMLLSTSGASANLLSAAEAGREAGMAVWALTGPAPNPLAAGSDEALCVRAGSTATVQELHLVTVHMVCAAFDAALEDVLGGGNATDGATDATAGA